MAIFHIVAFSVAKTDLVSFEKLCRILTGAVV
jgi:hypothetical protein